MFVKTKVKSINDYNDFCETNKEHQKLPYIVIVVDEMFNFLQIKEISDLLVKLLLNSERAGIVFLAFSKFNKKNLNLGPIEDLLEIYNNYDISKLLVNIQNDNINDRAQEILNTHENLKTLSLHKLDNITDEELNLRDNASIKYNENDFDEIIHNQ